MKPTLALIWSFIYRIAPKNALFVTVLVLMSPTQHALEHTGKYRVSTERSAPADADQLKERGQRAQFLFLSAATWLHLVFVLNHRVFTWSSTPLKDAISPSPLFRSLPWVLNSHFQTLLVKALAFGRSELDLRTEKDGQNDHPESRHSKNTDSGRPAHSLLSVTRYSSAD